MIVNDSLIRIRKRIILFLRMIARYYEVFGWGKFLNSWVIGQFMVRVFDVGRICVKTRGREAGKMCVIVDIVDDDFLLVTGPKQLTGVKRRKVNVKHVEPTQYKVNISKGASDEDVIKAIEDAKLMDVVKQGVSPNLYLIPTTQ